MSALFSLSVHRFCGWSVLRGAKVTICLQLLLQSQALRLIIQVSGAMYIQNSPTSIASSSSHACFWLSFYTYKFPFLLFLTGILPICSGCVLEFSYNRPFIQDYFLDSPLNCLNNASRLSGSRRAPCHCPHDEPHAYRFPENWYIPPALTAPALGSVSHVNSRHF